jgi:hypothetical protein
MVTISMEYKIYCVLCNFVPRNASAFTEENFLQSNALPIHGKGLVVRSLGCERLGPEMNF